ncbi:MAG: Ig-like domain-containing protein [Gemmatimonadetes bacterium]|nr:Ig-like domain-containing protein [Gemmatimonadota bacterium]
MPRTFSLVVLAVAVAACSEPGVITIVLTPADVALTVGGTQQLTATLTDQNEKPVTGVTVTWASANAAVATVSSSGLVRGVGAGATAVSARAGGSSSSVPVSVTQSAFDIELRNLTSLTAAQHQAFDNARLRWRQLVVGDLPDALLTAAAGTCGSNSPAVNEVIDDLVIFVTVEEIDGVGGTLGSAGPCYVRNTGQLPILGRMRFDSDDLAQLQITSKLGEVILHEMGHVLGFGTLWTSFGHLKNPSLPSSPGADTHFDGPQAIASFDAVGGNTYSGGAKVPVENSQGDEGTRDAHWRESVMDEELMTGFIEAVGLNPLSRVSVASLWDMGYEVNLAASDPYQKVFAAPAAAPAASSREQIALGNDVYRGPLYVVAPSGEVTRIVWR